MAPRTLTLDRLLRTVSALGMKSVIASCLAVTVAAVAFRSSELRDETLWWEEKFVVSKTEHWYVKCPPSADDDATWYHKNRGPDFDCAWVAQKPDTRCSVNGVRPARGGIRPHVGPGGVPEGHRDRTEVDGSPRSTLCGPDIDDDDGEEQGVAADLIRAR